MLDSVRHADPSHVDLPAESFPLRAKKVEQERPNHPRCREVFEGPAVRGYTDIRGLVPICQLQDVSWTRPINLDRVNAGQACPPCRVSQGRAHSGLGGGAKSQEAIHGPDY
jgi:hypothetical protein